MDTILVQEFAQQSGVDHANGVLRGARILGPYSRTSDGRIIRDYTAALRKPNAASVYEGALVTFGEHTPNGKSVDLRETVGLLKSPEVRTGQDGLPALYGNIELAESHPDARLIQYLADNAPTRIVPSHEARVRGNTVKGVLVVEEITQVQAVTLLSAGGTVAHLFEHKQEDAMDWTGVQPTDVPDDLRAAIVAEARQSVIDEYLKAPEGQVLLEAKQWREAREAADADLALTEQVRTYLEGKAVKVTEALVRVVKRADAGEWDEIIAPLCQTPAVPAQAPAPPNVRSTVSGGASGATREQIIAKIAGRFR
jgi:hypothetical protein